METVVIMLDTAALDKCNVANIRSMGGIQRAGTGKNKKVTEISPLLAFRPEGLGIKFL